LKLSVPQGYGCCVRSIFRLAVAALMLAAATAAAAQERDVPYWTSMRVTKANLRVGPSPTYRILWVYQRKGLPLKVLRVQEGWRLVQDPDGARGWLVGRFLSLDRTAIVKGKGLADMRESADGQSPLRWRLEPGVVGKLGDCDSGWRFFDVGGRTGYVAKDRLWGAGAP
jgi:SH3-like domain-containing protein